MRDLLKLLTYFQRFDPKDHPLPVGGVDPWLPTLAIGLALFGWVMVSSASIDSHLGMYYFSIRQGIFLVISLFAAFGVSRIPFRYWRMVPVPFYIMGIALLIIVLLVGEEINGSRRWIHLPGPLPALQPSEVAKIGLVLYMARFISLYREQLGNNILSIYRPLLVLAPLAALLFVGRDFGSAFIYTVAVVGMVFMAGTTWRGIGATATLAGLGIAVMIIAEPYRILRLISFSNPWADPFGSGYQLSQSLIGFGRGGLTGTGLGNSIQKLGFLPEPHNDFIFAIIGEELGMLGVLIIMTAMLALCYRIFIIARQADLVQRTFPAYFCYGVAFIMTSQSLINMGVATGLLPTKGLTLPLISYGGSSLLVTFVLIGMVFRVDMETRYLLAWREHKRQEKLRLQELRRKHNRETYLPMSPQRLPG